MCKDKDAVVMEVGIYEGKQNFKVYERSLVPLRTSEDETEMLDTRRFSNTFAQSRSMHV